MIYTTLHFLISVQPSILLKEFLISGQLSILMKFQIFPNKRSAEHTKKNFLQKVSWRSKVLDQNFVMFQFTVNFLMRQGALLELEKHCRLSSSTTLVCQLNETTNIIFHLALRSGNFKRTFWYPQFF